MFFVLVFFLGGDKRTLQHVREWRAVNAWRLRRDIHSACHAEPRTQLASACHRALTCQLLLFFHVFITTTTDMPRTHTSSVVLVHHHHHQQQQQQQRRKTIKEGRRIIDELTRNDSLVHDWGTDNLPAQINHQKKIRYNSATTDNFIFKFTEMCRQSFGNVSAKLRSDIYLHYTKLQALSTRNSSANEKPERDVCIYERHRIHSIKYKQQLDSSKLNINPSSKCSRRCASYMEYEKCNMKPWI